MKISRNSIALDVLAQGGLAPGSADGPAAALAGLLDLQKDLSEYATSPATLKRACERLRTIGGGDLGLIDLLDGDGAHCSVAAAGANPPSIPLPGIASLLGAGVPGDALTNEFFINDAEIDPTAEREACRALGMRSMLVLPLTQSSHFFGSLTVLWRNPGQCDGEKRAALRLGAQIVADTLFRAAMLDERQRLTTEHIEALGALRDSEQRFRNAFGNAATGTTLIGLDGRFLQVNPALCEMLGFDEAELLNQRLYDLLHPDDRRQAMENARLLLEDKHRSYHQTNRYLDKSGQVVWARLSVSLVRDTAGWPLYFVGQVVDVTDQKRSEILECDRREILELIAQDRPLSSVFRALTQMVERQVPSAFLCVLLVQDGGIHPFAPTLPAELLKCISDRTLSFASRLASHFGRPQRVRVSYVEDDPAWEGLRDNAKSCGIQAGWCITVCASDGEPLGLMLACCRDARPPTDAELNIFETAVRLATIAAEHHHTTQQLAHLVQHDSLTGLPNRMLFEDRLQQALSAARRGKSAVGLLALDLNRFKHVNDTLGHHAGDSLLQQLGQRLRSRLRESDTLARVGGDEFMVILPGISTRQDAMVVVEKLRQALASAPFEIAERQYHASSSIGLAMFPEDAQDASALQRFADAAMYREKAPERDPALVNA